MAKGIHTYPEWKWKMQGYGYPAPAKYGPPLEGEILSPQGRRDYGITDDYRPPKTIELKATPTGNRTTGTALPRPTIDLRPGDYYWLKQERDALKRARDIRAFVQHGLIPGLRMGARIVGKFNPWMDLAFNAYDLLTTEWYAGPTQGFYDFETAGFDFKCNVGFSAGKGPWMVNRGTFSPGLNCSRSAVDTLTSAVPYGTKNLMQGWTKNLRWVAIGQNNSIGTTGRMGRNIQWTRYSGSLTKPVYFKPTPLPVVPLAPPAPVLASPTIETAPRPRAPRNPPPPYVINGHPNLPPSGYRPPKKKFKFRGGLPGRLYGILTEAGDLLDCLEKNAGRDYKRSRAIDERVAGIVYYVTGGGDMNWSGFGRCVIENQVKDAVIGKFNKAMRDAYFGSGYAPNVGRSPGAGGWARRAPAVKMKGM